MSLIRRPDPRSTDTRPSESQIDEALRDLFAPSAVPGVRTGFDRRLARAIANDREDERRSRTTRRVLWSYWLATAVVSIAIVWQLQERLMSGPGLWIAVGSLVTLVGTGLAFSILTALPLKLGRLIRSL